MAGVTNTARLSARMACRHASNYAAGRRAFTASARTLDASNFSMPALSPTMTEGNIASWKVKEGDSYSPGDVLLEIETDKATMDVEAQDDGVLFKITQPDGTKGIQVGSRIAVMAEEGDDLGSLEMPAEKKAASKKPPKQEEKPAQQEKQPAKSAEPASESKPSSEGMPGKAQKQRYPLYPAVQHLLHEHGLSTSDADSIPASGPQGRLLKGDVLAHLGRIGKDYPAKSSARLEKLSHLDLSNIQLAAKPAPKPQTPTPEASPEPPQQSPISLPISLHAAIATQKRLQDTLNVFLPLSTFIARASELANVELPLGKNRAPTSDELFDAVVGLDRVPATAKTSTGSYVPTVAGLAPMPPMPAAREGKSDIIDMLAATKGKQSKAKKQGVIGVAAGDNLFEVMAGRGEERRAEEYLGRVKWVLEKEPGRLLAL